MSINLTVTQRIEQGKSYLGIEMGSTRIKAVLIDDKATVLASGDYGWENRFVDGMWTYSLDEVWQGLQACYSNLVADVQAQYGLALTNVGAIGVSGMMHGYLVFDKEGDLLVPFRTWRNNLQGQASSALTELFDYPMPQRWSGAHLYQAILNDEAHVKDIAFQTTLAGYVHWMLTGTKVVGVGEASGMYPIDLESKSFNQGMLHSFDGQVAHRAYPWRLEDILPEVKVAGEEAGVLTEQGAKLLDPSGLLKTGIPLCPPEGDAGTGMVATNSILPGTGNVSAGTSIFGMVVLDKDLQKVHSEIDQVTTPAGDLVAMAHANNCTSDLNAWVGLLGEAAALMGGQFDMDGLYTNLYKESLKGALDGGGLLSYGYISGEHMTKFEEGRPLFVRSTDSTLTLANFMRTHIFTALGALKVGFDILLEEEGISLDSLLGHGGLFKTEGVGQRYLSAAVNVPVSVMANAGEGGPWGMALLAAYTDHKGLSLKDYLQQVPFAKTELSTLRASQEEVDGYRQFMHRYHAGLSIESAAVEALD